MFTSNKVTWLYIISSIIPIISHNQYHMTSFRGRRGRVGGRRGVDDWPLSSQVTLPHPYRIHTVSASMPYCEPRLLQATLPLPRPHLPSIAVGVHGWWWWCAVTELSAPPPLLLRLCQLKQFTSPLPGSALLVLPWDTCSRQILSATSPNSRKGTRNLFPKHWMVGGGCVCVGLGGGGGGNYSVGILHRQQHPTRLFIRQTV